MTKRGGKRNRLEGQWPNKWAGKKQEVGVAVGSMALVFEPKKRVAGAKKRRYRALYQKTRGITTKNQRGEKIIQ